MLFYPTHPRFDAPAPLLQLCAHDERQLHDDGVDRPVLMLPYPTLPRPRFDAPTQHLRLCAHDEWQLHDDGFFDCVLMLFYPTRPQVRCADSATTAVRS